VLARFMDDRTWTSSVWRARVAISVYGTWSTVTIGSVDHFESAIFF
jgi:hypothetical protein